MVDWRTLVPIVDRLMAPLASQFPICDLFFEDSWLLSYSLDPRRCEPPTVGRISGGNLRIIGSDQQLGGSCSGLEATTLQALAERVGMDLDPCPVPDALTLPHPSFEPKPWRDALDWVHAALTAAQRATRGAACRVELEDGIRCAFSNAHRPRVWRSTHALFVAECWDRRGIASRTRMFPLRRGGPPIVELQQVCSELVDALEETRHRVQLRGVMPVVVGPGAGAVIFHELVGHPLEADFVLADASPFSSLAPGTQVTSEAITVLDNPDARLGPWGFTHDDEGVRARPAVLLSQGRVVGMLHDRVTAYRTASRRTGNGRRPRYYLEPEPRMRTLVVNAGADDPDALVASVRNGLYVARWGNGRSDLARGNFSLSVDQGWRIRHGRRSEPVRNCWVSGTITDALRTVEGVGRDFAVSDDPILCVKGGVVPTGVAGPTVKFSRLEVT